ncbi:ribosome maturation factor RimP [Desulfothermus okinawensis JCM 13304]
MEFEDIKEKLNKIVKDAVLSLGYDLWGMEFLGSFRGGGILRVYIDSPSGISISDCTNVSRHLDVILDIEDPIPGSYTLEVSSPGLDRSFFEINQLRDYTGQVVAVKSKIPIENRKKWKGRLKSADPHRGEVVIDVDGEDLSISWEEIEKIKLVYFD